MQIKLVILLHGVGSCGQDLQSIGQFWQHHYPELKIATPNAPETFMHSSDAFQWFSIYGVTEANRFERIQQARQAFDETIQAIIQTHQLEDHLDQVMLCGFSQGTIMALDAVVSGRWAVAGIMGFSGRLASPIEKNLSYKPKIYLMHGQQDQVIPVSASVDAAYQLEQAGLPISLNIFNDLGHNINQAELEQSLSFF